MRRDAAVIGDIAHARAMAMNAAKAACGNSIDAQFYAKRMLDRYELVMQEYGFGYDILAESKKPPEEPTNATVCAEPRRFQQLAESFAAFRRILRTHGA
jgi:hypothetical protein